jgi:cytochrome c553
MKNILVSLLLISLVFSCNNAKNKRYSAFEKQIEANKHPGKKLMETHCYTCHSPTGSHDNRIGPPMIAIKKHYINDDTSKEDFIADMQSWIKNPNADDAKMYGAVKRFGVMPKLHFPEETIQLISEFMYDYDIEQPDWFEDHFNEERGKHKGQGMGQGMGRNNGQGQGKGQGFQNQKAEVNIQELPYGERGLKYALTTKAVLGKNLMGTIQKKGTLEALAFCNEQAYPLTDSMATIHNANIKRVSDKPRNSNNQASAKELGYINTFKNNIKNNEEPKPIVEEIGTKVHVYYPITTNTMCLQCHGKPNEDIQNSTLKKLVSLYPQDKAIGYGVNEVRGIWSINFDK